MLNMSTKTSGIGFAAFNLSPEVLKGIKIKGYK